MWAKFVVRHKRTLAFLANFDAHKFRIPEILDFGFQILGFGLWALDFGL
jgi:hypothetical protein